MTYTIVIDMAADLLAACVPDGDRDAVSRELGEYRDQSSPGHEPDLKVINGLILTNDEPDDESRIKWRGHERGWLTDVAGATYQYAVRPHYQRGPSAGQP
jgi:cytochrome c1